MPVMSLKQDEANLLELEVLRRTQPMSVSSWDGNRLKARVRARVAANVTEFVTDLAVCDLERFLEELREGPPEDKEVIALQTLEGGVTVFLKPVSIAQYQAECTVAEGGDDFGPHILFNLMVAVEVVRELARQLELTLVLYPAVGERDGGYANGWVDLPSCD